MPRNLSVWIQSDLLHVPPPVFNLNENEFYASFTAKTDNILTLLSQFLVSYAQQ